MLKSEVVSLSSRSDSCTTGGLPFGVYAVVQNFNIPLQVQPQIFMALCLIAWAQILLYHR
jgi:hypothetical protein